MYKRPRVIHILGDLIFGRGYALNVFSDQCSPKESLYGFSSPAQMVNRVFSENNVAIRMEPYQIGAVWQANLASDLTALVVARPIRSDDWIVIEDAGEHNLDPSAYQSALEGVLDVALAAVPAANIRVMTIPEYSPAAPNAQWDTSFSGEGTMNQVIQAAAIAKGVTCIDMNSIIDTYKTERNAADGTEVMLSDGIHPNVWGQMKWTGAILSSLGLTAAIVNRTSLTSIASANYSSLAYGSGTWTQQKAIDYCVAILG